VPIDGNIGVRVVQTKNSLVGNKANFVNGVQNGFVSINQDSEYTNTLPSLNLRARLKDDLQVRFAASKVITRPDFTQLSPSLTLVPANGQASSGNPDLKPLKADQLDLSLEYYFGRGGSAYAATFYKKVKGFIQTTVTPNVIIDGIPYNLAQPANGKDGTIKGGEIGYQQFFDFLPSWLSGLGAQANYTYVESEAPSSVAGLSSTLPQLSKNSYNLVGIYERGPISGRIAYNWRSKFYESIFVGTGSLGVNPVYRKAYGWLDASVVYDINRNFSVALEGANLLRTKREGFYTVESRPNDRTIDDRQVIAGVRVKW
jgi:TonB-dependent receptor